MIPLTTTKDGEDLAKLKTAINQVWSELYPGAEAVDTIYALEARIRNIAQDRNDCAFNARVLQKAYNELDATLRTLRERDAAHSIQ